MTDKGPTASEMGRMGGKAGTGASKRRSAEFYKLQGADPCSQAMGEARSREA